MPATIRHELTATTPDATTAEIRPSHWNAALLATIALLSASEVSGAFSNANGISFGESDGKLTASYTVPAQSVQTQASGNIVGAGFTTTTAAGDVIAGTHNSAGLILAIPPYLTTYAAQSVQTQPAGAIAGTGVTTATTAGTQVKATLGTDGLNLAVPAYLTAAEGAPGGAGTGFTTTTAGGEVIAGTLNSDGLLVAVPPYLTTYAAQTVQTQASGNIPRSGFTTTTVAGAVIAGTNNTNGILLAVPAYLTTAQPVGAYLTTARASNDAVGLNTALTANGVAWTVNSSGISLNIPAFLTTAALSADSSKYAGTGFTSTTTAGTEIKATLATNGLSLAVPAYLTAAEGGPGGAGATVSVVEVMDGARLTTAAPWNNATYSNRPIFIPFEIDNNLTGCHTIRLFASRSSGTVLVATMFAGIYSRVNATSASRISSTSANFSVSTSAQYSGVRMYDITGLGGLSLPPGRYLLALMGSAAASNSLPLHLMGGDAIPSLAGFVNTGTNATAATATNSHIIPMWGVYTNVSAGLPANVAASEISGGGSQNSPDVYAIIKAI